MVEYLISDFLVFARSSERDHSSMVEYLISDFLVFARGVERDQ